MTHYEPDRNVIDNLDSAWAPMQEQLQSSLAVLLPGRVVPAGPSVDYGADLKVLSCLLTELHPRAVYVQPVLWTQELQTTMAALCHALAEQDEDYPAVEAAARYEQTRDRTGTLATVDVTVVEGGVSHLWSLSARWWVELHDDVEQLAAHQAVRRDDGWERERAKHDSYLAALPDVLVASEEWLVLTNERTRRQHADRLARTALGREVCADQYVRGRIATAVTVATQQRTDVVIPQRRALALEQLPGLAAQLRVSADYQAATTKSDRERIGRSLLAQHAPIVPAADLLSDLLALAAATVTTSASPT
jgi:hypothetical protein